MTALLQWRWHGVVALPVRVYLGVVFILASLHKIAVPESFALDVATYEILPLAVINLMAICLPPVELVAGLLLVLGVRVRASAWLIVLMMLMFMVALGIALYNGIDMTCGCFASSDAGDEISWWTMLRDAVWLVMGLYVLLFDHRPIGVSMAVEVLKKRKER